MQPYLSIVVPSRNDNHGGDLLKRMQLFVTGLLEQCRRYQIPSELIIVEWNPPADRPPLRDALKWPKEPGPCAVRIIEVPREIHQRSKNPDGLLLHQMIGKNVGIRRARGKFVLATNLDILFSNELMEFISKQQLDPARMYRIDRHDVMKDVPDAPIDEQLQWCSEHLIRVNAVGGTFPTMPNGALALEKNDVALPDSNLMLGAGWYSRELDGGKAFRWFDNNAEITVQPWSVKKRVLAIDIEPGPGVKMGPTTLTVLDDNDAAIYSTRLTGRRVVNIPVPLHQEAPVRVRLHLSDTGHKLSGDPRSLNARVVRCGLFETPVVPRPWPLLKRAWWMATRRMGRSLLPELSYTDRWPDMLHLTACGDFTMLARERWLDLRGYAEFEMFPMNIDSLFCWAAHYGGVKELVLRPPMRTYHIEHESGSGWTPEGQEKLFARMKERGVSWLDHTDVTRWACDMKRFDAPILFNRGNWGLGDDELKETLVMDGVERGDLVKR